MSALSLSENITCPALNPPRANKNIVTQQDVHYLVLSTDETAAGTRVGLGCQNGYDLTPSEPTIVKCMTDGMWDFSTKPTCVKAPTQTIPSSPPLLTHEEKIIVGVTAGVGGIILVVLFILIFLVRRSRKDERVKGDSSSSEGRPFNHTKSTGLDYDSWKRRYHSEERPKLGLTPITVPTPGLAENPRRNQDGGFNIDLYKPNNASRSLREPPQDYHNPNSSHYDHLHAPTFHHSAYYNRGYESDDPHLSSSYDRRVNVYSDRNSGIHADRYYNPRINTNPSGYGQKTVGNDIYYTPGSTSGTNPQYGRWASLERVDRPGPDHYNRDRINRTFDVNDQYLWRPASNGYERTAYRDHRL